MTRRQVRDRDVGLSAALVAGAAGVLWSEPALLVAASVGLVYATYEAATDAPEPDLEVERTVSPASPRPGQDVTVTVEVTNHGVDPLPDVRVVDGVPRRLRVIEGSPRHGTALEPDETTAFSYAVRARRGDHPFREATVVCRNLTGDAEYAAEVDVDGTVSCRTDVEEVSLGPTTLPYAGRVETDAAGEGVSFHGVREYRPADSMSRVDWNRFARTNELTTVEYQSRRTASVVVLVDNRMHYAARPRAPTATQYAKYAGERIATALLDEHNLVGAALFGDGQFLEPSSDRTQALRIRRFLLYERDPADAPATDGAELLDGFDGRAFFRDGATTGDEPGAGGPAAADGGWAMARLHGDLGAEWRDDTPHRAVGAPDRSVDTSGYSEARASRATERVLEELRRRMDDQTQVVFCTPLLDEYAADAAGRLAAVGHDVTVVSPDVTSGGSPGSRIERLSRSDRIDELRGAVDVVDWSPTDPLPQALDAATARWSR